MAESGVLAAPMSSREPLIEALSTLSEQDRRTISRGLRLLRAALDPEAQDE